MTSYQRDTLTTLIKVLRPKEFHHGCCIGSDEQAHNIVFYAKLGTKLILHPPIKTDKIARGMARANFFEGDDHLISMNPTDIVVLEAFDYLVRNVHIADRRKGGLLIATPFEDEEVLRSGTWTTIRRAKKLSVPVLIIQRDGRLRQYA